MERKSRSLSKNCYLPQIRGWHFRCPAAHQYMYEVGAMTRTHPTPCWSPAQTPRQIPYSGWKTAKQSKPAGIQNSNELAELGNECNVIRARVSSEELPRTHTRGWTNPPIGINATMCTLDTFSWICWLETCVFVFLCLQLSGSEGRHLVTSTLQVEKEQNTPRGWSRDQNATKLAEGNDSCNVTMVGFLQRNYHGHNTWINQFPPIGILQICFQHWTHFLRIHKLCVCM